MTPPFLVVLLLATLAGLSAGFVAGLYLSLGER